MFLAIKLPVQSCGVKSFAVLVTMVTASSFAEFTLREILSDKLHQQHVNNPLDLSVRESVVVILVSFL